MRGEERLLLVFSLPALSARESEEAVEIVKCGVDWERFVRLAQANRIFPQAFEHLAALRASHPELLPDRRYRQMKEAFSHISAQKMVLLAESRGALKALSEAGVKFTPFKGYLLQALAYPEGSSREFSDMDLLLRDERERAKAQGVLEGIGFGKLLSGSDAYHVKMVKRKFGVEVAIELHVHPPGITHLYPYPKLGGLWEGLAEREVGGIRLRVMRPEAMLLVTALNAFRDGEVKLKDISDMVAITSYAGSFDWGAVQRRLSGVGWSSVMALPLAAYAAAMTLIGRAPPPLNLPLKIELEGGRCFFPLQYSSLCERLGCAGKPCRACPILIQREVPPITDLMTVTDAFKTFPPRVRVSATLLVTCVRRECGSAYAIRCSLMMARYLLNVFAYMLKLTALRRRE